MNTIILPGYSIKNKEWAEKTKAELDPTFLTTIHYWKHWNTETPEKNWIENEINLILKSLPNEKVNILAKSIGTLVSCFILKSKSPQINKLILCGIPTNDISETDKTYYDYLKIIPPENILCIQNDTDPHGSFQDVTLLLSKINRNIKIISKPRGDHEYPYVNEFINFLR